MVVFVEDQEAEASRIEMEVAEIRTEGVIAEAEVDTIVVAMVVDTSDPEAMNAVAVETTSNKVEMKVEDQATLPTK